MNEFDDLNFDEYEKFLENYEHTPDDDVWGKIRTGLPETSPVGKAGASGKVVISAFWKVAAIGFFTLLMSAGFLYFSKNNNEPFVVVNDSNEESGANVDEGTFIYNKDNSLKEKVVANTVIELKSEPLVFNSEKKKEKKKSLIVLESQVTNDIDDLSNSLVADISLNNNKKEEGFKQIIKDAVYEKVNIEQKENFSTGVNNNRHANNISPSSNEEKIIKNTDSEITDDLFEKGQGSPLIIQDQNESVNLLEYKQDYLESVLQEHKIEAKKHFPENPPEIVTGNLEGLNITVYGEYGLQNWQDTEQNSERLFWDSKLNTKSHFAAGVLIGKNFTENISFQTGLEFSEVTHSFKTYGNLIAAEEEGVYILELDTYLHQYNLKAMGKELVSMPSSDLYMNTNHRFRFLSIPIWARYSIDIGSNLDLGLSAGFSTVFLAQNRLQLIDYANREIQLSNFEMEDNSGINDLSFSMSFATDLEYSISRRTKLLVQASYKESIKVNNISNNIKLKGLNFRGGLKFLL